MNMSRVRREAFNQWAADFWFWYKPDEATLEHRKKFFEVGVEGEQMLGHKPLGYRGLGNIDPSTLAKVAESYAYKWEMPISSMGLLVLVQGCEDANQVQMMVAAGYKRFVDLKKVNKAHDPMDALFVATVLQEGSPSPSYLAEMWVAQKVSPGELYGDTHRNLLDYITAGDFQ